MQTDKQLYSIFKAGPHWLYDLLGQPVPAGGCAMHSITLKALERRLDGLVRPHADHEPLLIVEFQWQADPTIYARIVAEMALVQIREAMRPVRGLILFAEARIDPRTEPWHDVVQVEALPNALKRLARRVPDHPLLHVFAPLCEENDSRLEKSASHHYKSITSSPLPEAEREALAEAFLSWLLSRFKNLSRKEIITMLDLPSLKQTACGREMWEEGRDEGREQGIFAALKQMARRKFPRITSTLIEHIETLDYHQAEILCADLVDMKTTQALAAWLRKAKKR